MSNSLWPHGLQHTRLTCPSQTPRAYSNSCPSSQWCHSTISSSDALFFCPQCFPASGTFSMSQLFTSGDQNIGVSASASVLPMNIQGAFPLGLTGLISVLSKGLSGVFSSISSKALILWHSAFFTVQLMDVINCTTKQILISYDKMLWRRRRRHEESTQQKELDLI